ncbi:MAG: choice-of-anchor Q domain-containing protein, partial [Pseudomonadota bacterium]
GVFAAGDINFELKYSTVAENEASIEGGGLVANLSTPCTVARSLFDLNVGGASNTTQDIRSVGFTPVDCEVDDSLLAGTDSEFTDGGGNILGQASLIEPLADNGGNGGRTHALPQNSPAIDAAGTSGTFTPDNDQRGPGFPREFGAGLDMGAFEFQVIIDEIFNDRFESP